jgi:hypothetical protein
MSHGLMGGRLGREPVDVLPATGSGHGVPPPWGCGLWEGPQPRAGPLRVPRRAGGQSPLTQFTGAMRC